MVNTQETTSSCDLLLLCTDWRVTSTLISLYLSGCWRTGCTVKCWKCSTVWDQKWQNWLCHPSIQNWRTTVLYCSMRQSVACWRVCSSSHTIILKKRYVWVELWMQFCLHREDSGSKLLWNVCNCLPDNVSSCLWMRDFSSALLSESQFSYHGLLKIYCIFNFKISSLSCLRKT